MTLLLAMYPFIDFMDLEVSRPLRYGYASKWDRAKAEVGSSNWPTICQSAEVVNGDK